MQGLQTCPLEVPTLSMQRKCLSQRALTLSMHSLCLAQVIKPESKKFMVLSMHQQALQTYKLLQKSQIHTLNGHAWPLNNPKAYQ